MRRTGGAIVLVLLALGQAADVHARQSVPINGVVRLLLRLEQLMQAGTPDPYMDLLSVIADRKLAREAAGDLISPGITRAVIRERDRSPLEGTLPGDGYRLMVEIFIERGDTASIETWRLDIRRVSTDTSDDEWRIAGQQSLSSLEGLLRLSLNPSKMYRARDLVLRSEDLEIRLLDGYVYLAEGATGPTAAVLLPVSGGTVSFRPSVETEREQVRIFARSDTIQTSYEGVFVRFSPLDFRTLMRDSLSEAPADPAVFRRADALFREDISKTYGLDLADLSRETWSLQPFPGDFLAELHTRRFQTLTYSKAASDAEDISLFDRRRRRNISVYASAARRAAGVSRFDEDARAAYDVLHYDLDVSLDPNRLWLDGRALLRLRVRADAVNTLTLRLAENLTVRSVYSNELGRLLAVRVRGQNNVIVNLNGYAMRGAELALAITYSGRLEPVPPDREAAAIAMPQDQPQIVESLTYPAEPSFLYSTRTYWYPQGTGGDYATAVMHLTVPEPYGVVASGELAQGSPVVVPGADRQPSGRRYTFEAGQPVRYLAFLVSRLARVGMQTVSLVEALAGLAGSGAAALPADAVRPGSFNSQLDLAFEANPRQASRARQAAPTAADVASYYTSLVGDSPYPDLTLAFVEKDLPGGHSPAYLGVLYQAPPAAQTNWASDPAAFPMFPEYFLAHEVAHQWWGQAVGWRTYHDQWISEGFAQYFAALYASRRRGNALFGDMMRRMVRWSREHGEAGPVSLGYRLGHIQGNSRIMRAIVYNKAAVVLHMLRRMVGDEAFFRGMRRLYFAFRFNKASTDDVRQAFERESGQQLQGFFNAWINGSGTPEASVAWSLARDADEPAVVVRIEQRGKTSEFPVTVTLRYAGGEAEDRQIVVRGRSAEFRLPIKGSLKDVVLNRDGFTPLEIARR